MVDAPAPRRPEEGTSHWLFAQWTLVPGWRRRAQTSPGCLSVGWMGRTCSLRAGPPGVLRPWWLPAPLTLLAAGPGGSVTQRMRRPPRSTSQPVRPGSRVTAEIQGIHKLLSQGAHGASQPLLVTAAGSGWAGDSHCRFIPNSPLFQEIGVNKPPPSKANFF